MNPNDIPRAKTGLSGLFNAKKNHSIIIPESMVASAEAYTSKRERANKDRKGQQETGDPPPYPQDPIALAREFKMTETEFLEEQKRALKEHEEQKRKKDQQKAKREVKQALGESITPAEQQRLLDEIQSNKQAESGGKQGSPNLNQSSLDVGRRDNVKKQRSLQPQDHLYDTIPGGNDTANFHRHIGAQGKSSSIAQAEGVGESFQSEFHGNRGGHGDRGDRGDRGGHGGHGDHGGCGGRGGRGDRGDRGGLDGLAPYDSQHKPADESANLHENLHESNVYQGGAPPQQRYGNNRYQSGHAPVNNPQVAKKQDPDYVNVYDDPEFQQYIQPNADARPLDRPLPSDQPAASHHHFAGATRSGGSQYTTRPSGSHHELHHVQARQNIAGFAGSGAPQYVDQPTGSHHQVPVQQNFAAATAPPGSSLPVDINPNLTVGSRIQIPTQSPTEPFKYGVIRWIGEVPAIQGLVAGIEMVSI